jgi:hypothetical protein
MADQAVKLVSAITTVNATHASLETFFAQIDELDRNVSDTQHGSADEMRHAAVRSSTYALAHAVSVSHLVPFS